MEDRIPRRAYAYIGIMAILSMILTIYVFSSSHFSFPVQFHFASINYNVIFVIFFWSLLAAISESLTIILPNGMGVSVGFAIYLAAMLIGGPQLAIIVAAASYIFSFVHASKTDENGKVVHYYSHIFNTPYYKSVFNIATFVISAGSSALVYSYFTNHQYGRFEFVPTIITVFVYLFVNSFVVSELMALLHFKAFAPTWLNTFKGVVFNIIAVGMIGIILALAFISYGPPAVILFFAPLLLARYSFKLYLNMKNTYIETIAAFNKFLEARDNYTSGHSSRVLEYAEKIGAAINLRDDRMENLKNAAILHDIGKIGINDNILRKPSSLSNEEYMTIKDHVRIGAEIIDGIDFLKGISKIVAQHHERPDGKGYPNGIKADDICIEASILSIADVFDAMRTNRPYRDALPMEVAISELRNNAGTQFDPNLVDVFIRILEDEQEELKLQAAMAEELSSAESEMTLMIGRQEPITK